LLNPAGSRPGLGSMYRACSLSRWACSFLMGDIWGVTLVSGLGLVPAVAGVVRKVGPDGCATGFRRRGLAGNVATGGMD